MDGYKIVYKEPDGTIIDTFFGEPMLNFCLPNFSNLEIIKLKKPCKQSHKLLM